MIYFIILSDLGIAKFAAAASSGSSLAITEMAIGDGNGAEVNPVSSQLALTNEVWRGAINRVYQSPDDAGVFIAEGLVPKTAGGWTIREIGLFDSAGDLIAVGSFPERYKATVNEGAYEDTYVRVEFKQSNASVVTIVDNPSAVMATQKYVDDNTMGVVNAYHPYHLYVSLGILSDFVMSNQKKLTISPGAANAGYGRNVAISLNGKHIAVYTAGKIHVLLLGNDGAMVTQDIISAGFNTLGPMKISGDGRTIVKVEASLTPEVIKIFYKDSAGVWGLQGSIIAPLNGVFFGDNLALSPNGSRLVVTASSEAEGAVSFAGCGYVYDRNNAGVWSLYQRIVADVPTTSGNFGTSVAMSANTRTIAFGAKYYDGAQSNQGAVYVVVQSTGNYGSEALLTNALTGINYNLGESVSLSAVGDTLLAGVVGFGVSKGGATVFTLSNAGAWSEVVTLFGADSVAGDKIGSLCELSASGKTALLVSDNAVVGGNLAQGAGYLFQADSAGSWTQESKLVASDGVANDRFGNDIAMSADTNIVLFGVDNATVAGNTNQGAVYKYNRI